ncbi:MAG: TrkH family potassium uptake protein [Gammaproteobacteria bacterium]
MILHVPALMALLSVAVCLVFQEFYAVPAFLATALVAGLLAQALFAVRGRGRGIHRHHAMLVAALSWLAVAFLGALPFLLVARWHPVEGTIEVFATLENAFFESLSGFTATGLTMVSHASELPYSLQWWRSFTEWVGGVGVIVLMLAVLPPGRDALQLYYSEAREQRILPSIQSTTKAIWSVYLSYTLVGILLLWLAGEPLWRAVNHGMTAIATGGFTITDNSLEYASTSVAMVYMVIMVLGGISFLLHYRLLWRQEMQANTLRNAELRLFLLMLGIGGAVLWTHHGGSDSQGFAPLFHWVSALTTAGFQVSPVGQVSTTLVLWLILAMTVGAMAGSTGGGVKQIRIVYVLKGVGWRLRGILGRPHEVLRYRLNGIPLAAGEAQHAVEAASVLLAIWLLLMFVGVVVLLQVVPVGTRLEHVIFEMASAQGNVGLSAGLTHADLPLPGKLVLMVAMWTGRLEIVPVLAVLFHLFARY